MFLIGMVLEVIEGSLKTAQSISEFGLMVVICAFFVVLSALMMIAMFRWQMNTIDSVMKTNKEMLSKLDAQMQENNKIMQSIAEGLIPKTMLYNLCMLPTMHPANHHKIQIHL